MQINKNLTEKKILIFSIILTVLILSIIPLIRFISHDSLYPGQDPYYHERIAKEIKENGIPDKDPLISRPYILDPYHLLLAGSLYIKLPLIIIPFLLGILSTILAYLILKKFEFDIITKTTILAIFITSPIFIYLFSTSNSYALPIFLFLLGFYLFIQDKNIYIIPSYLILALITLSSPLFALTTILFLLSYSLNNKNKLKQAYIASLILIIISLIYYLPIYFSYGFPNLIDLSHSNIIIRFVSDLGAAAGFGVFFISLALVGLYSAWQIKKQVLSYSFLLLLIIISFYYTPLNTFLNLIFALLAGHGFLTFLNMRWKLNIIKTLTIVVLICGLIFSSISYINRTAAEPPNKDTIKSLEWFSKQPEGITLSHYKNGYWIETIANKPALLDQSLSYIQDPLLKFNDSSEIFYSRNLETTRNLLTKHNISYIWITKDMKQGEVWTKEEQGLLFLFRNNETFKNLYSSKHAEIWQVR